jgi:pyruvate formate-lyase/glycerol dehydratase family glycyl radical enzyme
MAATETHPKRKAELLRIAETCDWVPANPARSFYEAVQSVWFTYVLVMIEVCGTALALGRADQYLYPFYKRDVEEGRITREEALELLCHLFIKTNGLVLLKSAAGAEKTAGFSANLDLTLGGITKDRKDAVNELSYLFLEADEIVRLRSPEVVIRVNKITPDAFLMKVCNNLMALKGKYKFISDDMAIQQLINDGKPPEDARNYILAGCRQATVAGRVFDIPAATVNLPLMMELALNNGVSRLTGEQIGPKTGNPREFKSYDEVWNAYKRQAEATIPLVVFMRNSGRQAFADFLPSPFHSSLFDGCIKKGLDMGNGGPALVCTQATQIAGGPNVGDSLAAIKKTVFEDRSITMSELIDALDANFEGHERTLRLLKDVPKYGNDVDYVDYIVNDVLMHFTGEMGKHIGIAGTLSTTAAAVVTANIPMGEVVGALPDGRKAGEPIAEGGVSPHQGRNVSGPTATFKSVAKLDHARLSGGSVLNMRFNPDALKDETKIKKFVSLIRTFCETGGFLCQFNIIGVDTLRDAQKHPENYRDLLVRVATYAAYFVEVAPKVQEDIIARMEFQEV